MAMAQLVTSWPRSQLFDQTIALVTDDPNWMVQAQSNETLVLRRVGGVGFERYIWQIPTLVIKSSQQISIRATEDKGKTTATINYTSGARKTVATLLKIAPQA